MPRTGRPVAAVGALLALCGCSRPVGSGLTLVVESVEKAGSAEAAGLKAGDALVSWSGPDAKGALASPFDLTEVEIEQAPRGIVTLHGRRGRESFDLSPPAGSWGLRVRPALAQAALERLESTRRHARDGQSAEATRDARALAAELDAGVESRAGSWVRLDLARRLAGAKRWDEAHAAYAEASAHARARGDPSAEAEIIETEAETWSAQLEAAKAEEAFRRALVLREHASPESLAVAIDLQRLARLLYARRADDPAVEPLWQRSLVIRERTAPRSLQTAASLQGLASTASSRGDLEAAAALSARAWDIARAVAPESDEASMILSGLGIAAKQRGDLAEAEGWYRRALAVDLHRDPEGRSVAYDFNYLGTLAKERGDFDAAEAHYRRALALFEKLTPDGAAVAGCLNNLGNVAKQRRDWPAAEAHHRRALAMREKIAPTSLDVAASLHNLGDIALERGDLAAADDLYSRALIIKEKRAPRTLIAANTIFGLGDVAARRGDHGAAFARQEEALAIRTRLAPGTAVQASSLQALGRLQHARGRRAAAARRWEEAIAALEAQRGRLGRADATSGFGGRYASVYQDLLDLRVEDGRAAEGFAILERFRARGLLALLSERDLVFADLPVALERARREADAEYDRSLARLGRLGDNRPAEIAAARGQLEKSRERQADVGWRIRSAAPRLAALRAPAPVDATRARETLDEGTLLLSYGVGPTHTVLFAVRGAGQGWAGGSVSALVLPIGEDPLRDRVRVFRGLLERGRSSVSPEPALQMQAAYLYDALIRPAQPLVAAAKRVLLIPDGPLHALPFGALLESGPAPRTLAEWKPLHTTLSATVYAEIKKSRRTDPAAAPIVLVAFGDPQRGGADSEAAPGPSLFARATNLGAIPFARDEVRRIASLFGDRAVGYLGAQATEERARSLGRNPRYIHFACHAVLDLQAPLDSALVLSPPPPGRAGAPGRENGLLQAWEIFERVRLDADLVTLSACQTAGGREVAGEGLIGLSRAFQYAGARTVLASLWPVADRSTADLMESFYRGLREGRPKVEALQAAQVEMIRRGASPFQWAAFQLSGDWK